VKEISRMKFIKDNFIKMLREINL